MDQPKLRLTPDGNDASLAVVWHGEESYLLPGPLTEEQKTAIERVLRMVFRDGRHDMCKEFNKMTLAALSLRGNQ